MTKRILVVEDEAELVKLLVDSLRASGFEVLQTADGSEVVPLAAREKPDLILLDVLLPRGMGFDICVDLKSRPETRASRVVLMTALTAGTPISDDFWRVKYGADDFISKPFGIHVLLERVRALLSD
jgi:DNA-binding response OmpR family regulator